jgi:hypothetical protein
VLHSSMQAHSTIVAIVVPVALPAVWAAGFLYRCWRLRVEARLQERRYQAAITASLLGVAATFGHDGSVTVVPTGLPSTPHGPGRPLPAPQGQPLRFSSWERTGIAMGSQTRRDRG